MVEGERLVGDEAAKVREGKSDEVNSLEALNALRSEEEDEDAVIYMTITHSYTNNAEQSR